jgi:uncharacterized protein YraI
MREEQNTTMKRIISISLTLIIIAMSALVIRPAAAQSPGQTGAVWYGEFYNNAFLIGPAVFTRQDNALAFNWGTGSPGPNVPVDNFSARWGADIFFPAGTYRFSAVADDAVALIINFSNRAIDTFNQPRPGQTITADVTLPAGTHHFQVDFRELSGDAYISLSWVNVASIGTPTPQPNQPIGTVLTDRLNVRSGPGVIYSVITVITRGQTMTLVGRNSDTSWLQIVLPGNIPGWVNARYIQTLYAVNTLPVTWQLPVTPTPIPPPGGYGIAFVNTGALNMRTGPGVTFPVITRLPRNTALTLLGRSNDALWVYVAIAGGTQGWVSARYIITTVIVPNLPIASGQVTPTPPASGGTTTTYVVQAGDNLFRIALRFGISVDALAAANGITNYNQIYVGQVLAIPVVASGGVAEG